MAIRLKVQEQNIRLNTENDNVNFNLGDSVQVVQSGDYDDLANRPQINGVTLTGNKTTEDLGIEAGVTSWNGETGDVVFNETDPTVPSWAKEENPPSYEFAYDESMSVGYAEVGEAVTGEPNYTPSGTVTGTINGAISQSVTKDTVTMMYNGSVSLNANYNNYVLTLSTSFNPSTVNQTIVTNVTAPTFNGTGDFTFNGTGVTFAIEQEN